MLRRLRRLTTAAAMGRHTDRRGTGATGGACAPRRPACLDLRSLLAPEPFERALAAADALGRGEGVELLTPKMPYPLLELLGGRGLQVSAERLPDGSARLFVRRPD